MSTGALAAPFAFLGPDYDPMLEKVYTTISARDVFKKRGTLRGVMGDAMADSAPLRRMVERFVDQELLDAVAAEYAKGRLLLVGTANLDALEPVIWNMTAIAAAVDALFVDPNLGRNAIYEPAGGGPVSVRVVARRADAVSEFGGARLWSETTRFDVRIAEVANPRPGDRIVLDGEVISSPEVNEGVGCNVGIRGGATDITGNFTPTESKDLAALIEGGSLPLELTAI